MARDIGFTITVKGTEQQLKKIGLLEQELKKLSVRRAELIKISKTAVGLTKAEQTELGRLTVQIKELGDQKRKTTTQVKDLNKEIKASTGSYNQLVLQNKRLVTQLRNLSDPLGKNKKRFQELSGQITTNTDKLKRMDSAMGRQQRNVGNYSGALGGLKNSFVKMSVAIGAAIIAFRTFSRLSRATIGTIIDFDQAVADLSSVLGINRDQMQALTEDAQRLGATTAFTATEVAKLQKEFAKLGFSEEEILNATEATLALAAATNTELSVAARVAGATIRGFGLNANQTRRVVDVMAKSFSSSALDMDKFQTAMSKIAPVAKAVGLTIEETTGLMGGLADAGLEASIIGTSLRRIFIELSKKGLTLEESLTQIRGAQDKLNKAEELFGARAATAALVMAENSEQAAILTEKLNEAAGTADEMARKQLATLQGRITILKSAWEGFILSLDDGSGVISKVINDFVRFATNLLNVLNPIDNVKKSTIELFDENNKLISQSQDLIGQYEELSEKAELTADESFKLQQVTRELSDIFGDSVVEIDKETGALTLNIEAIKQQILLRQALQSDQAQELIADKLRLETRLKQIKSDKEFLNTILTRQDVNLTLIALVREQESASLGAARASNDLAFEIDKLSVSDQKLAEQIRNSKAAIQSETFAKQDLEEVNRALIDSGLDLDAMAKLLAQTSGNTTDIIIDDSDKLTKEILSNNNKILNLQRKLIDSQFAIKEESTQKQIDIEVERFEREKEDLEKQKGEVEDINDAINDLIEAKQNEHEQAISDIKDNAAKRNQLNDLKNLAVEEKIAINGISVAEGTEEEKQQAILLIQIEFAKKRLELLKTTGDLTLAEVRLQISELELFIAEATTATEGEEVTGIAKLLNITPEDADLLINKALQVAKSISDAVAKSQEDSLKRQTKKRLDTIQDTADTEIKILQNRLDKGFITEGEFALRKEALDNSTRLKEEAARKDEFDKQKSIDLLQVAINTALAVTKAIAQFGPPPSPAGIIAIASALAVGGIQAGFIASKKFERGGDVGGLLVGPSHAQGGIKAGGVEFQGREGVVNARSMQSSDVISVTGTPRQVASAANTHKGFGVPFGSGSRRKFQLGGEVPTANIIPSGVSDRFNIQPGISMEQAAELILEAQNAQTIQVIESDITDTQNDVAVIEALSE